jgi:hypothetical protein
MVIFLDLELSGCVTFQAVGHPPQAMRPVTLLKQAADPVVVEQGWAGTERRAELVTGTA